MADLALYLHLLLFTNTSTPQELVGIVVSVHDGDTIKVRDNEQIYNIRLVGIDAPELKQPFGVTSQRNLSRLVLHQNVTIIYTSKDKYNRLLGQVFKKKTDINKHMVVFGYAWHYAKYSKDEALAKAQEKAQKLKRGLWANPSAIPPWEFRAND